MLNSKAFAGRQTLLVAFVLLSANQCALANSGNEVSVRPPAQIYAFSNVFSLKDIEKDRYSRPDYSAQKPFAIGETTVALSVRYRQCVVAAQNRQLAVGQSHRDAIRAYALYENKQFDRLSAFSGLLQAELLAFSGHGGSFGCDWPVDSWAVGFRVHALDIESLRYRRYNGQLISYGQGARLDLSEELIGFEPQVSGLQAPAGHGRLLAADLRMSYQAPDEWFYAGFRLQNAAGELRANAVPYLRRNAQVAINASGVDGRNVINRVNGRYGTTDVKLNLPRLWNFQAAMAVKQTSVYAGVELIGVDASFHPMFTALLRCKTCSLREGYTLALDGLGQFVSLGYKQGEFAASLTHRLEAPSLAAVNAFSFSYGVRW